MRKIVLLILLLQGTVSFCQSGWTEKEHFPAEARKYAIGFSLDGFGYIGTGYGAGTSGNSKKDIWRYDPATNIWTQVADFGGGEWAHSVRSRLLRGQLSLGSNSSAVVQAARASSSRPRPSRALPRPLCANGRSTRSSAAS